MRALKIAEKLFGAEHPKFAVSLDYLARLYLDQWQYEVAYYYYLKALKIREKQLGAEHLDVVYSLNNLAYLYKV